jgi:hypothetical protein
MMAGSANRTGKGKFAGKPGARTRKGGFVA